MALKRRLKLLGIVGIAVGTIIGIGRRSGGRIRRTFSRGEDDEDRAVVEITIKEPENVETRTEIEER